MKKSGNEPEAAIVQLVFNWYVNEKFSLQQIVDELNRLGLKSRKNHDIWATSSIGRILINTAYIGYFYFNKNKKVGKKLVKRDESEWIRIECTPIIPTDVFEAAQEILEYNKEYIRKHPKRFYLLGGMVICSDCQRPYLAQVQKAGHNRRKRDQIFYRHRKTHGHCCNRWITANKLEPLVWERVVNILLHPMSLREGYEQNMEKEQQKQARQIKHLETIQFGIEKLQAKKARLQAIYLDPDIGMTKEEYLGEKKLLDDQIKVATTDIERISSDLQKIPTEQDLESLEHMASKIVEALGHNLDISPQNKRRVMDMLNLKVFISTEGNIKLEGWFLPESDGFSSTTSAHYAYRLHISFIITRTWIRRVPRIDKDFPCQNPVYPITRSHAAPVDQHV